MKDINIKEELAKVQKFASGQNFMNAGYTIKSQKYESFITLNGLVVQDERSRSKVFSEIYNAYKQALPQDKVALKKIYSELQQDCGITVTENKLDTFKTNMPLARDYMTLNRLTGKELEKVQNQLTLEDRLTLENANSPSIFQSLKIFIVTLFSEYKFDDIQSAAVALNNMKSSIEVYPKLLKPTDEQAKNASTEKDNDIFYDIFKKENNALKPIIAEDLVEQNETSPKIGDNITLDQAAALILKGDINIYVDKEHRALTNKDQGYKVVSYNSNSAMPLFECLVTEIIIDEKYSDPCKDLCVEAIIDKKQLDVYSALKDMAPKYPNLPIKKLIKEIEEVAKDKGVDLNWGDKGFKDKVKKTTANRERN